MSGLGISVVGGRVRVAVTRFLGRMGLGESSFLLLAAVLIAVITAGAAVAFHELIGWVRDWLYVRVPGRVDLYGRGLWKQPQPREGASPSTQYGQPQSSRHANPFGPNRGPLNRELGFPRRIGKTGPNEPLISLPSRSFVFQAAN